MDVNSGQIDLNTDVVLLDRENEVVGFNLLGSNNVSVGVSHGETLTSEPVGDGGGEVQVFDQKVCHVGGDDGVNGGLVEPLSEVVVDGFGMKFGCDVMVNGSGKEGSGEGRTELVGRGNGLEVGLELVEGRCHGEQGKFSGGLVRNDDKKIAMECFEGVPLVNGGAGSDKGLVYELNSGVQNEVECDNAGRVCENSLLSANVASVNEARGVDNLTEHVKGVKNAMPVNVSVVAEDGTEMKAADNLVTKDGLEDSHTSEITTCQLQDGFPDMEVVDVNVKESLHYKDSSFRNHHVLTSYESKQQAFQVDAQEDAIQNQTIDINLAEAGPFENIQVSHDINLVVDLNCYRNMPEVDLSRQPVFSELNFCVSDLVWGKVVGHPWWPGQIFDSSAASEEAKRHLKKDSYLIAYFGDQTFAWNDALTIKPFQMHFSQMVKQSNLEGFHHAVDCALDEVSRRVEFSLSCPCMPKEVFSKLKSQVITNAGICGQARRRNGGDRFTNATSFESMKLVNFIKSLARSSLTESDRLDFVIARAQLLAYNRSKGYSQLPEFSVLGGLLNDMEILLMKEKEQCNDQIDGNGLTIHLDFSQKHKHSSRDSKRPSKRHKLLSDLMSEKSFCIPNGEHALERKAGDKPVPRRCGRKRKAVYNTSDDNFHTSQNRKSAQLQYVSMDEMRSQLCSAASDPVGQTCLSDMVYFFAEFRKFISCDSSAYLKQEMSSIHMPASEDGATSTETVAPMTSAMEPCKDSYWTDRIIQCISEEQSSSKNRNGRDEFLPQTPESGYPFSKSQPASETSADRYHGSEEPSKLVEHLDESSTEGFSPTALSLKFTSLESVPSTTDLNKIFGRFGPLIESRTELIEKSNRARVVFRRRSDAETAFSSAGKYSIFGPSLVSYRLRILPRTPEKGTRKRGRPRKKERSCVDTVAV